jgi:hypothetical protein
MFYARKRKEKKMTEVPKRVVCVNCGRKFKTTLAVKGGAEPVCFSCRKKKEAPKLTGRICGTCEYFTEPNTCRVYGGEGTYRYSRSSCCKLYQPKEESKLGGNLVECGSCGKRRFMPDVFRVPGIEGYTCAQCVERLKKDRPTVMSVTKIEEVMTENPIHERFLVVEGRSCGSAWVSTYVYTHPTQEEAIVAIAARDPRDGQTCKLLRISSSAPIELEELSLGYDIKVVNKVKR